MINLKGNSKKGLKRKDWMLSLITKWLRKVVQFPYLMISWKGIIRLLLIASIHFAILVELLDHLKELWSLMATYWQLLAPSLFTKICSSITKISTCPIYPCHTWWRGLSLTACSLLEPSLCTFSTILEFHVEILPRSKKILLPSGLPSLSLSPESSTGS